jgi:Spy/CpxP family protein refolding chaperone
MKSNRKLLAGSVLAAGALLTAGAGISIAIAADATTPAAPVAPAPGHGPHGGWHHHHHGGGMMLSKLNLTPEQQASVKTIFQNAAPQFKSIGQEMHANSLKLRQTQPTDAGYPAVVAQVTQANGSLHSQMITQREAVRAQIFKVLTPEQQAQLKTLQAQMQAKMQARQAAWAAKRGAAGTATAQ